MVPTQTSIFACFRTVMDWSFAKQEVLRAMQKFHHQCIANTNIVLVYLALRTVCVCVRVCAPMGSLSASFFLSDFVILPAIVGFIVKFETASTFPMLADFRVVQTPLPLKTDQGGSVIGTVLSDKGGRLGCFFSILFWQWGAPSIFVI